MSLFLTILKIIGIVILVVLLVVLTILLLVLFVPVRYRVDGRIEETDLSSEYELIKEKIYLKAGFTFLLHLVRGGIDYPDTPGFTVKILWFQIYPSKIRNDFSDSVEIDESSEIPTEMEEGFDTVTGDEETDVNAANNSAENAASADNEQIHDGNKSASSSLNDEEQNTESENGEDDLNDNKDENKRFIDDIKNIFNKISEFIQAPQNVYTKIKCTISSICAKIEMIRNTLNNDIFKRAFEITKKQLLRVLKRIVPHKCRINILLGIDDPVATADVFAAYGFLYPVLVNKVYLQPDFERSVIAGSVNIKGKIRLVTILWAAAVLYFNKDVRKTVRRFKKIINS